MHSSEISYDRNLKRTRSYENGLGVEFLLFVDQFYGSPTRSLFLSLFPFLSLFLSPCIRSPFGYSSPVFAALRRTPINRIIRERPLPWNGQLIWPRLNSGLSHFQNLEERRQRRTDENHRRPLSWMRYSVRNGGRDGSILMSLLNFNDVRIPSTAAHVILRS